MTQPFPITFQRTGVPVGIGPPNRYYVPLQNPADLPDYVVPLDFTTVTSVQLSVLRTRDGSTATWTTSTFLDVTTAGLVAVYAFQTGDCPVPGDYEIRPYAIVPAGQVPLALQTLHVDPQ